MTCGTRITGALAFAIVIGLAGCGLSEGVVTLSKSTADSIEAGTKRVDALEQEYRDFAESPDSASLREYAEREQWDGYLAEARTKIESARAVYEGEVVPLLERDSSGDEYELRSALSKIPPLVAGAGRSAEKWVTRRDRLVRVREDLGQILADCESALTGLKETLPGLEAKAESAKQGHPARAAEIDQLVDPLKRLAASTAGNAGSVAAEINKSKRGGDVDLGVVADSCLEASRSWAEFQEGDPGLRAKLTSLDRSFSRTLIDMKQEYDVVVRRESWDTGTLFSERHQTDFRVDGVAQTTYAALVGVGGPFAVMRSRDSGISLYVTRDQWDALGIDPVSNWPSGDTGAEFRVADGKVRYFHKYLVQEDGETTETDWTEVDEAMFQANVGNLGMDVESKPYGAFDDEKLTQAAPPGMAYVGNPHYGRWVSDGRGGSVWNWIGPYLFYRTLFGSPMSYGRSEWTSWNRNYRGSRPYYGGTTYAPRWGTRSRTVQTSPKMRGSEFAQGGGFRRPSMSARTSGSISRGGSYGASGK